MLIRMKYAMANTLVLNKRCEFWHHGENVALPIIACSTRDLAAVLDRIGGEELAVEFSTTGKPDDVAADVKKYGKRLAGIGNQWSRSDFAPKVIRGFVLDNVYTCTLKRQA